MVYGNCSIFILIAVFLWCAAISAFIFSVGIHNILLPGACEMFLNVSYLSSVIIYVVIHLSPVSQFSVSPAMYGMSLTVSYLHWSNLASLLQLLTLTYCGSCTVSADDALELLLLGYTHIPSYGCAFHG